jgi:hypothetical protein
VVILHDPRVEPGFELPTDHRWCLCFGQQGGMTDTVERAHTLIPLSTTHR